jgi:hypothetical protein
MARQAAFGLSRPEFLLGLFLILSAIIWKGERASSDRMKAELREVHTQTILLEAQHLLSVLQETEAAQRDYVNTARPDFSSPTTRDARRSGYLSIA